MTWKKTLASTLVLALAGSAALVQAAPASAASSRLQAGSLTSDAIGGDIDYTVYLPDGYDPTGSTRYPTMYLLHGRGDTQAAWQQEAAALDELIAAGEIPPMIVVMPDAPWSDRGNYYVDSLYTGAPAAAAVETAFTNDLITHIDETFPTIDDRLSRVVGGYSMGGAGALRFATVLQDLFTAGIVLSPAVYVPTPPADSSTREFGAYGVGESIFDEERYEALNYPAALEAFDPDLPVHLFIAVGDDEWANASPADAIHDLDYEAATLYNRVKRVPGISAEFRVYDGGHEWSVWDAGFREGLRDLAGYLRSTPPLPFGGSQFGSAADDRAGGVLGRPGDGVVQVVNAAGPMLGQDGLGGFDILVQRLDAQGVEQWVTPIAGPLNDRAYGVVDGQDDAAIVAGFSRLDHSGGNQNDDALVAKIAGDGAELWRTSFGAETAADRVYGVASDGAGGAFVTGYTSGVVGSTPNAGDKDVLLAHVTGDGQVSWATQFGSPGEDKGYAVASAPGGGVYVGGLSGAALPGEPSAGGYDGWVARFDSAGQQEWITALGTAGTDQVSSMVATATGVAVTGYVDGTLPGASGAPAGGVDAFAAALSVDGGIEWTAQHGSAGDDRGAAVTIDATGRLLVVGHTDGRIASPSGDVDVFTLTLDSDGALLESTQFGSRMRDGADEYDEANLYISGGGSTWIQLLTYGAVDGQVSAGAGDVVLTEVDFDAVVSDGSQAGGGGSPSGPSPAPGAGSGSDASSASGPGGWLSVAGLDVGRALLTALVLLVLGGVFVAARRRSSVLGVSRPDGGA